MAETVCELGLQPVINGVEHGLLVGGLKQSIVGNRVKGQSAELEAIIEIETRYVAGNAVAGTAIIELVFGLSKLLAGLLQNATNCCTRAGCGGLPSRWLQTCTPMEPT